VVSFAAMPARLDLLLKCDAALAVSGRRRKAVRSWELDWPRWCSIEHRLLVSFEFQKEK